LAELSSARLSVSAASRDSGNKIPHALQYAHDRLEKQFIQQGSQWVIH
jgi:hypothetical protein